MPTAEFLEHWPSELLPRQIKRPRAGQQPFCQSDIKADLTANSQGIMAVMPKLLLNLRNVPDDEAEEVSALMAEQEIECYQTPPGPFGITNGGIWLRQPDDYERARRLLDRYQAERARRAREDHEQARREGRVDTLWSLIRRNPIKTAVHLAAIIFILIVFFTPLLELGRVH